MSNAGIFQTLPFEDLSPSDWRRMIDVHLHGGFFLAQPAFTAMRRQGYGRFVFVASSAGLFGQPNSAHYAAAKAGPRGPGQRDRHRGGGARDPRQHRPALRHHPHGHRDGRRPSGDSAFLRAIAPELVVPLVVVLASRDCAVTHHNYSACAGRFARAFVGLGQGWLAPPGSAPTAEDVAAHWDEVSAPDPYMVPTSIFDEVAEVCERLGL